MTNHHRYALGVDVVGGSISTNPAYRAVNIVVSIVLSAALAVPFNIAIQKIAFDHTKP